MRLRSLRALALLAAGLVLCGPTLAHDAFGGGKPLLSGATHLLTSPLSLAAMVGLIASAADARDPWPIMAGGIAGTMAVVGGIFSQTLPQWTGAAGVIVVGVAAAVGTKTVPMGTVALSFVSGLAAGTAAKLDNPALPAALGTGGVLFILTAAGLVAIGGLPDNAKIGFAVSIARRIAGAWVVAIGTLLSALALKTHGL